MTASDALVEQTARVAQEAFWSSLERDGPMPNWLFLSPEAKGDWLTVARAVLASLPIREQTERAKHFRKMVHDRMFACQDAADEEREANGETAVWLTLRQEAEWLNALLVEMDASNTPATPAQTDRVAALEAALRGADLICHDGTHLPNASARVAAITDIARAVLEGKK